MFNIFTTWILGDCFLILFLSQAARMKSEKGFSFKWENIKVKQTKTKKKVSFYENMYDEVDESFLDDENKHF